MATKTTTSYSCDGCQKPAEKAGDLRRFILSERTLDNKIVVEGAKTELCIDCEKAFHEAALAFFPPAEAEKLHGIVRG